MLARMVEVPYLPCDRYLEVYNLSLTKEINTFERFTWAKSCKQEGCILGYKDNEPVFVSLNTQKCIDKKSFIFTDDIKKKSHYTNLNKGVGSLILSPNLFSE